METWSVVADGRRFLNFFKTDIVREVDISRILPQLVKKLVFSYVEQREILSYSDSRIRTELFLDRLVTKGPKAIAEFCYSLASAYPSSELPMSILNSLKGEILKQSWASIRRRGEQWGANAPSWIWSFGQTFGQNTNTLFLNNNIWSTFAPPKKLLSLQKFLCRRD